MNYNRNTAHSEHSLKAMVPNNKNKQISIG